MVAHKLFLPDVTVGDEIHDWIASFMKLIAQVKNIIARPVRKIGMTLIILNVGRLGYRYDFHFSLSQEKLLPKTNVKSEP